MGVAWGVAEEENGTLSHGQSLELEKALQNMDLPSRVINSSAFASLVRPFAF